MNKEKIFSLAETWGEYFLWAFIFFTPIGHGGAAVFFGLLAFCFVVRKIIRPDFSFLKKSEHLWLLIFFVFCGISLFHSGPFLQKSLKALFLKWGEYAMVFFIVRDTLNDTAKLKRVGWVILGVAGMIGVDCAIQSFRGSDLFYGRPLFVGVNYQALTATFKNSNNLASYLAPVTLAALGFALSPLSRRKRWLSGGLATLLGGCLFFTFSRGSWIGFFGGLLFMIAITKRWKIGLFTLGLFAIAILLNPTTTQRATAVFSLATGQKTDAFSERSELFSIGTQLVKESPLIGKGVGTFMDYCGQRAKSTHTDYAHNCYLQMWAESGVFSLLAFLLFLGTIFRKGIRSYSKTQDPLTLGLLCGLFAFLIHSAFDTQFYSVAQSFLLWSMLGILVAAADAPSAKSNEA